MPLRLFHFSEEPSIEVFTPRPVAIPTARPPGQEWLNGALVWTIDEWHGPMYMFPRDCPRILIWPKADTTSEDRRRYFGQDGVKMIAHIEERWFKTLESATLYCYELPIDSFESLDDAGMWVSKDTLNPLYSEALREIPELLESEGVELRLLPSLAPLKDLWNSSLHVSGIRLRNAKDWR